MTEEQKIFAVIGIGAICLIGFITLFWSIWIKKPVKPVVQKAAPKIEAVIVQPPPPAAAEPSKPTPDECESKIHIVRRGDSLWKIAKRYYGKGYLYKVILEVNRDKIKNADLIYKGQEFVIPGRVSATAPCLFDLSGTKRLQTKIRRHITATKSKNSTPTAGTVISSDGTGGIIVSGTAGNSTQSGSTAVPNKQNTAPINSRPELRKPYNADVPRNNGP